MSTGHPNWCLATIGKEGKASSGCQWGSLIQIIELIQAQMWFLYTVSAMTQPWHIPYIIMAKPLHLRSRFLDWRLQLQYRKQMPVTWPIGCIGVFKFLSGKRNARSNSAGLQRLSRKVSGGVATTFAALYTPDLSLQILRCEVWVEFLLSQKGQQCLGSSNPYRKVGGS